MAVKPSHKGVMFTVRWIKVLPSIYPVNSFLALAVELSIRERK